MQKIVLKKNNLPTQTGYYMCLMSSWGREYPILVRVRLTGLGEPEFIMVSEYTCCNLQELEHEDFWWSDEIDYTLAQ